MSRQAIAAALARDELSLGERLVAFSLASFADRDGRMRPGTPAAAGRAGLKRSWFLEARDALERRGLIVVEDAATGRGRATTLRLPFAQTGPWWEGEINAELFEAVLSYSRAQGAARLLLAAVAALADERRVVDGVTTRRLCAAAGLSDTTYRRARIVLLSSSELVLRSGIGGRGKANCWELVDPRSPDGAVEPAVRRRAAPPAGVRPLLAAVSSAPAAHEGTASTVYELDPVGGERVSQAVNGAGDRTLCAENRPVGGGVSSGKGAGGRTLSGANRPVGGGVSVQKGAADRTVSRETQPKTPPKTPPANARAGREPQNPRTTAPPQPPKGASDVDSMVVEETYLTERGRRRPRLVVVDLGAVRERLRAAGEADLAAWEHIRGVLREAVGDSTFEIWLAQLDLIAVDLEGTLVVAAPPETLGWIASRFGRVLDTVTQRAGRRLRLGGEVERRAAESLPRVRAIAAGPADAQAGVSEVALSCVSASGRGDTSSRRSTDRSAYPSSYTTVYNPSREVS